MLQLGSRRTAPFPHDVGTLLRRGQCHCVSEAVMRPWPRLTPMSFVVDSADHAALPVAAEELHALLDKPRTQGIPLLVLGNKSDLPNKMSVDELIDGLDLKAVSHREVSCYGISAKTETNLDAVLQWLVARTNK
ncbi:hypothetical protein MRB53_042352 [Persea americana]|nr:hypothetical protein MRB53_042352 [Persea americana]